jgi:hypothetical protein
MSTKSVRNFVSEVRSEPEELALALIAADSSAVQIFVQILERHLTMDPLSRIERVWQISASQTAAMFGVSRQAYSKWHLSGVPAERREDVSDLDVATDEPMSRVIESQRLYVAKPHALTT